MMSNQQKWASYAAYIIMGGGPWGHTSIFERN